MIRDFMPSHFFTTYEDRRISTCQALSLYSPVPRPTSSSKAGCYIFLGSFWAHLTRLAWTHWELPRSIRSCGHDWDHVFCVFWARTEGIQQRILMFISWKYHYVPQGPLTHVKSTPLFLNIVTRSHELQHFSQTCHSWGAKKCWK